MLLSFMVKWDVSTTMEGQEFKSEMTQYIKGKNMRTDVVSDGFETRTYISENKMSTCILIMEDWQCNTYEYTPDETTLAEEQIAGGSNDYRVIPLEPMTILGIKTECFRVQKLENSYAEYCFASDGMTLYQKTVSGQTTTVMQAKSYSKNVDDSVFKLPV